MMTLFSLACAFGAGAIVDHCWKADIWPAIKAHFAPTPPPTPIPPPPTVKP